MVSMYVRVQHLVDADIQNHTRREQHIQRYYFMKTNSDRNAMLSLQDGCGNY